MLETARLILRPLRLSDAQDLLEYQSNSDVVRFIPWPARDQSLVIEALEKAISIHSDRPRKGGDSLFLAWELKGGAKVVGQSNLTVTSGEERVAEIGWVTHQDFQRQGLAFEATRALIDFAFNSLSLNCLLAKIDVRNLVSVRLAERLGMSLVDKDPQPQVTKGEDCMMWTFEIRKTSQSAASP